MGGNTFYTNAEAYALEILQQKLLKEAQRSAQQTCMELSALKSFLGQGQLIYCIPFGGVPITGPPMPFPFTPINGFPTPDSCPSPLPPSPPPAPPPPPPPPPPSSSVAPSSTIGNPPCLVTPPTVPPPVHHPTQSVVHVNMKNAQSKIVSNKPGSDECNLGRDGIEVTIDLREYLPADIHLDVDEKLLEIRANHVNPQGCKTFSRRYDLPACIILDTIRCILTHDGFLLISAAWCKME